MSAIGYSFARSVDEGEVQASNQVLWDAHFNRAGLAQHWNYKKGPRISLHYKSTRELGKGYSNYYWGAEKEGDHIPQLLLLSYHSNLSITLRSYSTTQASCPKFSRRSDATKIRQRRPLHLRQKPIRAVFPPARHSHLLHCYVLGRAFPRYGYQIHSSPGKANC